jgi:hypothetical protein
MKLRYNTTTIKIRLNTTAETKIQHKIKLKLRYIATPTHHSTSLASSVTLFRSYCRVLLLPAPQQPFLSISSFPLHVLPCAPLPPHSAASFSILFWFTSQFQVRSAINFCISHSPRLIISSNLLSTLLLEEVGPYTAMSFLNVTTRPIQLLRVNPMKPLVERRGRLQHKQVG